MVTTFRTNSALFCLFLFLLQFLFVSCSEVPESPHLIGRRDPYVTGRILIKFRPGASAISMTDKAEEFDLKPAMITCGSVHVHTVRPGTELEAAETLCWILRSSTPNPTFDFAATEWLTTVAESKRIYSRTLYLVSRRFQLLHWTRRTRPTTLCSTNSGRLPKSGPQAPGRFQREICDHRGD